MLVTHEILCHHCFKQSNPDEIVFRCTRQSHTFQPQRFVSDDKYIHFDEAVCDQHDVVCTERLCPSCNESIPNYAGRTPESMIAVAGSRGSGKTILTLALLEVLIQNASNKRFPGYVPMFEDEGSHLAFREKYERLVKDNQLPSATGTVIGGGDPDPIRIRLYPHRRGHCKFLVFHDGPGEVVESLEDVRFVRYLANASTILLTLDTDRFFNDDAEEAADEIGSPSRVLNAIVNNVRSERGIGNTEELPMTLAVTFTKCENSLFRDFSDLTPIEPPKLGVSAGSREQMRVKYRAWQSRTNKRLSQLNELCPKLLRDWGHDNFVNMLREFRSVRFYTTNALTEDDDGRFQLQHTGVLEPLLASFGFLKPE